LRRSSSAGSSCRTTGVMLTMTVDKPIIGMLIVDDEPNMREILSDVFSDEGVSVDTAADGMTAVSLLDKHSYDVAVVDLKLPDITGIDVIREIRRRNLSTVIIMITAYSTVDTAIEAMKLGAYDYITKPFKVEKLKMLIDNAISGLSDGAQRSGEPDSEGFEGVVGRSQEMRQIFEMLSDLAPTNATVLIYGESGTGKELLASYIHKRSLRANRPFIKVNCAAIPETLLESELFGHEKGAFTNAVARRQGRFELANGGSILLDEIGEMSLSMQSKLLRVVQEKEFERVGGTQTIKVDVRIIAATNQDLASAIREGRFREDLYYRLSVVPITLPPLRKRKEDIEELAVRFLRKYSDETGKPVTGFSAEAIRTLKEYDWPGNIRELENCVERAVILSKGQEIQPKDLYLNSQPVNAGGFALGRTRAEAELASAAGEAASASDQEVCSLEEMEERHMARALDQANGDCDHAAELLEISRELLLEKMKKYGIER
jgi:two-component system response regulator AtoC